ncbi:DUF3131 domain-containing protein [Rhodobacteraceae bacterium D3-12]|nr:DUF3131 domain-containing protein [Rhodobacteraceae bacterium D3-12]
MKRRSFLASSIAAGVWAVGPANRGVAALRVKSASVILTDITAETDTGTLFDLVERFLENGVWVTCVIRLGQEEARDEALAATLEFLGGLGGGVDLALEVPALASLSPYFQARAVYEASKRLRRVMASRGVRMRVRAVMCDEVEKPMRPTGVRSSGIRNVLVRPRASGRVRSETWDNGVVRFFGGEIVDPALGDAVSGSGNAEEDAVFFYLPMAALARQPEGVVQTWGDQFSKGLVARELQGQLALMTVSDLQLRDQFGKHRLIAVILEAADPSEPEAVQAVETFRGELLAAGIPSAVRPKGATFWANHTDNNAGLMAASLTCDAGQAVKTAVDGVAGAGGLLAFDRVEVSNSGVDGCAVLHVPEFRAGPNIALQELSAGELTDVDIALVLPADLIRHEKLRRRVLARLGALRQDAITRFVPIGKLAGELLTNEPVALRHRLTRAAMARAPQAAHPGPDQAERARLLDDAKLAWTYFETYTEAATGLCPATVNRHPGGEIHRAVTMWDVGSNLNAIVAATELGLIERKEAEKTFRRILPNLAGRVTDGVRLPQGWIRTDRHRWGVRDFDGCDGGRLLASLDNVRRRFGMEKEVSALVSSWNLDKIVVDRQIHSVIKRELRSTFGSHCAHYSALAFRRWGLDVASPYETFAGRSSGDGEMAMLEAVSKIGPLGAEPLLLEAMELGMSPESGYLAEVLFAALEEEFAENGRLLSVSETPIDRKPWFIYQGLELGSGPRNWRLDTVGHQPEYLSAEAAEEFLTFSTKAAYLWAAYRPGPFADKLLEFARSKARYPHGFASGVHLASQRAMHDYSDLNSNAIILQSISHTLRQSG